MADERRARNVTPEALIAKYFMEAKPEAVHTMLSMIKGLINSRPDCHEKTRKGKSGKEAGGGESASQQRPPGAEE